MIPLLAGELQRLLSRRLVRVVAMLLVVAIAVAGLVTFLETEQVSDATLRRRTADAAAAVQRCVQSGDPRIGSGIVLGPDGRPLQQVGKEEVCRFRFGRVPDKRFKVRSLKGVLQGTTAAGVVIGWLIGASSIGAEWQSRSITTLLTWEPRRARVLLAKLTGSILVTLGISLAAWALLSSALVPSALLHGTTAGTGGAWGRSVAAVVLRGSAVIAIATTLGFSVASLGRNTAAALGVGFAYFLIIENVVGSFLAGFRRWLLLGNAIVLISGRNSGGEVTGRSVAGAALYLSTVAVALVVIAVALFRRRDVA